MRTSVSISTKAVEQLRSLQANFERKVGFEPSLAQIVELLIKEYVEANPDKVTDGHDVQQPEK
jgi:hypothetical protein